MLYYFILIFNLFINSCYSTHDIVQCINWPTDFTKIIAFHNSQFHMILYLVLLITWLKIFVKIWEPDIYSANRTTVT